MEELNKCLKEPELLESRRLCAIWIVLRCRSSVWYYVNSWLTWIRQYVNTSGIVISRYRNFATIRYHGIANIYGTIHHDTPWYRPSMKQQITWYHRHCVWCVQELRRKISSQCVLMLKYVRLTLDKYLSSVYPSPNLTFSHNTKTEQHSCKEDSWPQIDGSITAMRKHGECLIRSSGILVKIHWYTQLRDITDQSNTIKMIVH